MAKTRKQLQDAIQYRLRDPDGRIWKTPEVIGLVKEGYDELCLRTGMLWKQDTPVGLDDVAGQALYDLPSDLYKVERVTWDQKRLIPLTARQLRETDYTYDTTQGDVYAYTIEQDGIAKLRKVRIPPASRIDTTTIEYQRRGAALSTDDTAVELPDRYAKYIVFFAISKAYRREGPGQSLDLAEHYRMRFELGVARIQARKSSAQKARLGRLGGSSLRSGPPPRPRLPWNFPER